MINYRNSDGKSLRCALLMGMIMLPLAAAPARAQSGAGSPGRGALQQRQTNEFNELKSLGEPNAADTLANRTAYINAHNEFVRKWTSPEMERFADPALNREARQRLENARIIYEKADKEAEIAAMLKKQRDHFNELGTPRDSAPENVLNEHIAAYMKFLDEWGANSSVDAGLNRDVQSRLDSTKMMIETGHEVQRIRVAIENLERFCETEPDLQKQIDAMNQFLTQNPRARAPALAVPDIERVIIRRDDALRRLDQQNWNTVLNRIRAAPERYSQNREIVRGILQSNPNTAFGRQAQEEIKRIEREWDRENYERVRNVFMKYRNSDANRVPTPADVSILADQMREYRDRSDPPPQMKNNVNDWLKWYQRVSNAKTVAVYIDKVEIKRRSYLDHRWDGQIMLRVCHRDLRRGLADEIEHNRTNHPMQNINLKTQLKGIPYVSTSNIQLEVISRWGWTRGTPDRIIAPTISIVSMQVPLMQDGERTGTIYVNVDNQPSLPEYSATQ